MHIGIDIIEAERFAGMERDKLAKMFSPREIEYFHKKNFAPETIAGMFCAKEAFFKALGTGITPNVLSEIEVLHNLHGAPYYNYSPKLTEAHHHLGTAKVALSISNTKTTSVAVCVIIPPTLFI